MQSTMFFVKTDLLLQERGFELLKEFVELFDESPVFADQYSTLYIGEDTKLRLEAPTADIKYSASLNTAIFLSLQE